MGRGSSRARCRGRSRSRPKSRSRFVSMSRSRSKSSGWGDENGRREAGFIHHLQYYPIRHFPHIPCHFEPFDITFH